MLFDKLSVSTLDINFRILMNFNVHAYIHKNIYTYICTYIHTYINTHTYVCTCINIYLHTFIYTLYTHTDRQAHIHTYINLSVVSYCLPIKQEVPVIPTIAVLFTFMQKSFSFTCSHIQYIYDTCIN